jgi:hypothetical protein
MRPVSSHVSISSIWVHNHTHTHVHIHTRAYIHILTHTALIDTCNAVCHITRLHKLNMSAQSHTHTHTNTHTALIDTCDAACLFTRLNKLNMSRVGQNRTYTLYMTVYLVIPLPKIPYVHRIYMVLANPIYEWWRVQEKYEEARITQLINMQPCTWAATHIHTHKDTHARN